MPEPVQSWRKVFQLNGKLKIGGGERLPLRLQWLRHLRLPLLRAQTSPATPAIINSRLEFVLVGSFFVIFKNYHCLPRALVDNSALNHYFVVSVVVTLAASVKIFIIPYRTFLSLNNDYLRALGLLLLNNTGIKAKNNKSMLKE